MNDTAIDTQRTAPLSTATKTAVGAFVAGSAGIAILWASGQEFPFYPPPGMLIQLAAALLLGFGRWRWTPAAGAFVGLFLVVGFVVSGIVDGAGFDNLAGANGIGHAVGQWVLVLSAAVAAVAGVVATRRNRR